MNKLAEGHRNQQKIMGLRMVSKTSEGGPSKRPRDPWDVPSSTNHHNTSTKQPHEDSLDEFTREHSIKEQERWQRDFVPDEDGHLDFQAEDYLKEDEEDIRLRTKFTKFRLFRFKRKSCFLYLFSPKFRNVLLPTVAKQVASKNGSRGRLKSLGDR